MVLSFIFLWIVRPTCTAHYLKGWPLFRHVEKPGLTNSPFTSSPLFRIRKLLGWRLWSWIYAQIHPSALLIHWFHIFILGNYLFLACLHKHQLIFIKFVYSSHVKPFPTQVSRQNKWFAMPTNRQVWEFTLIFWRL